MPAVPLASQSLRVPWFSTPREKLAQSPPQRLPGWEMPARVLPHAQAVQRLLSGGFHRAVAGHTLNVRNHPGIVQHARADLEALSSSIARVDRSWLASRPDKVRDMADELTHRAALFMAAHGENFHLSLDTNKQPLFELRRSMDGRSELGFDRLLHQAAQEGVRRVTFEPIDSILRSVGHFNWETGVLGLPLDGLTEPEHPVRRHEIDHARYERWRSRGKPFGLHGEVVGLAPSARSRLDVYRQAQAFEECATTLDDLSDFCRLRNEDGIIRTTAFGLDVSIRTRAVCAQLLRQLNPFAGDRVTRTSRFVWLPCGGVPRVFSDHTVLANPQQPGGYGALIPLIGSQGTNDPANMALLQRQLRWAHRAATASFVAFRASAMLQQRAITDVFSYLPPLIAHQRRAIFEEDATFLSFEDAKCHVALG